MGKQSKSPAAKKKAAAVEEKKESPMVELIGPNLLAAPDAEPKPTDEVLKGKELVAVYFSASWCPPCKRFTPMLIDFYNKVGKDNGLEVVYISSDHDMDEFKGYFQKMPWVSQPVDLASAHIKDKLAKSLKISGIPALIILNVKTGKFVTDQARTHVTDAHGNDEKGKEVLQKWKQTEAVPISEAQLMGDGPVTIRDMIIKTLRNPMVVLAIAFLSKRFFKLLAEWSKKGNARVQDGGEL